MSQTPVSGGGAHSGVRVRRAERHDKAWRSPADFSGADDRQAAAEVVVTLTFAARKLGADFPIFEQRMHEKALSSAVRAGLAIRDFAGPGVRR